MERQNNIGTIANNLLKSITGLPFYTFKSPKIDKPENITHSKWPDHLSDQFNKPGMRVLEIGSRNVTGANFRHLFSKAEYVGFDYMDGENVDVVGDAHRLPEYFDEGEKFDLIFSSAVFEHLYMPWIAVEHMVNLLKVEGHIFVETHFSYVSHERPWNFFQFSDMGLRVLFNEALGLEVVECGMSNPITGYFNFNSDPHLRFKPLKELYCHSEILVKKVKTVENFDWKNVEVARLVGETSYPKPKMK